MPFPPPTPSADPTDADRPASRVAEVVLVESEGCHLCADAGQALADLARHHPVRVAVVDARSAEGRALLAEHRPALNPLVLLDGEFFSQGRLPRRKLLKELDRHARATSGTRGAGTTGGSGG